MAHGCDRSMTVRKELRGTPGSIHPIREQGLRDFVWILEPSGSSASQ
jgi:hypothetical protein